jgi:ribosomal protein L37AE/L43A
MFIGVCRECKQPIVRRNSNAVYCSSACRERWNNRKHKRKPSVLNGAEPAPIGGPVSYAKTR